MDIAIIDLDIKSARDHFWSLFKDDANTISSHRFAQATAIKTKSGDKYYFIPFNENSKKQQKYDKIYVSNKIDSHAVLAYIMPLFKNQSIKNNLIVYNNETAKEEILKEIYFLCEELKEETILLREEIYGLSSSEAIVRVENMKKHIERFLNKQGEKNDKRH